MLERSSKETGAFDKEEPLFLVLQADFFFLIIRATICRSMYQPCARSLSTLLQFLIMTPAQSRDYHPPVVKEETEAQREYMLAQAWESLPRSLGYLRPKGNWLQ